MTTDVTSKAEVLNAAANHLPALWVAAAIGFGGATIASLQERVDAASKTDQSVAIEAPAPRFSELEIDPTRFASDGSLTTNGIEPTVKQSFPLELGIVERVIDGDTYDIRLDRTNAVERVRLAWIDTPEPDQPFGAEASEWANALLLDRRVVLTVQDRDRYGRLVAQLSVQGDGHIWDAGASLARDGLGWVDPRYAEERQSLSEEQSLARSEGLGLWSDNNPIPPWEWRQGAERGDATSIAEIQHLGKNSI